MTFVKRGVYIRWNMYSWNLFGFEYLHRNSSNLINRIRAYLKRFFLLNRYCTVGQKIWKSPGQKTGEINKSISRKFSDQIPFFTISKINFWTGKKFKTGKNAILRKNYFDLFDFTSFMSGIFHVLADCVLTNWSLPK